MVSFSRRAAGKKAWRTRKIRHGNTGVKATTRGNAQSGWRKRHDQAIRKKGHY